MCRNQKVARDLLELDCFHPVRIVIVIVTRIEGARVSSGKPQAGRALFRKRISKKLTMRARDRSRSLSGYRLRSCAILGRSSRLGCDPVSTLFPPPPRGASQLEERKESSLLSCLERRRTFSKLRSSLTPAWVLEISSRRRCLSFSMSPRRRSFSALRFIKSVRSESSRFCFRAAKSTCTQAGGCWGVRERACGRTLMN